MLATTPLLLGAALLFWGWQAGFFVFACIMALVLEASRLTSARWEFDQKDYDRIWNLCAVLLAGIAIYCFASNDGVKSVSEMFRPSGKGAAALANTTRSVLVLFQWWPMVFFPIMAAQTYGTREKIDFSTFSWLFRRHIARQEAKELKIAARPGLNISFVYFGICLFAASAQKSESPWFLPGLGVLVGWALFTQRVRSYSAPSWAGTLIVTLCIAFGAQLALREFHRALERVDSLLLSRFSARAVDASGTRTALGAIGRLSLSGKILIRLSSTDGRFPNYLRESSYNIFSSPFWHATRRNFGELLPETNDTTWIVQPATPRAHSVRCSQFLGRDHPLLAAPTGVAILDELPVFRMETNRFGAFKVDEGPGFLDYLATYQEDRTADSPPDEDDLAVPPAEEIALAEAASQAGLAFGVDPREALSKTARFFEQNFHYSSYLTGQPAKGMTPVEEFLLHRRSGHCEFFASATTLLLRKVGIPTRYAVGYSVCEIKGQNAIVRERHAHAWCLVYRDGNWHDFDTTPASWSSAEADRASWWEPIRDAWSRAWFAFSKWRYGKSSLRAYVPWLLGPLVVVLLAQVLWRNSKNRKRANRASSAKAASPGLDSEFYKVHQVLSRGAFTREPHESILNWFERIKGGLPDYGAFFSTVIALHYRLRFDPKGLTAGEREELRTAIGAWLEKEMNSPRSRRERKGS